MATIRLIDEEEAPGRVKEIYRGRHADIDYGHVGPCGFDPLDELFSVRSLPDHFETGLLQQSDEALTHDDHVVGDH
jgi:hypothetical protein